MVWNVLIVFVGWCPIVLLFVVCRCACELLFVGVVYGLFIVRCLLVRRDCGVCVIRCRSLLFIDDCCCWCVLLVLMLLFVVLWLIVSRCLTLFVVACRCFIICCCVRSLLYVFVFFFFFLLGVCCELLPAV